MRLGKSDIEIKPVGLGCWAIGGQFRDLGTEAGWGDVEDSVSLKALDIGLEMGIQLLDTANIYGAGHSEKLIGQVMKGKRDKVIVATKFGILCDEGKKCTTGHISCREDIRKSCEGSLRRLGTDYIDIFHFHLGDFEPDEAVWVRDVLEDLVKEGKIRYYGWSTPDTKRARVFAEGKHCISMEFAENVMEDNPDMRVFCRESKLSAICRTPLAMGLLTGKYNSSSVFGQGDLRGKDAPPWMNYYIDGKPNEILLNKLEAVREILTSGGRTLAQGCIAWIWGTDSNCIPIPGFKNGKQVKENLSALDYGPLKEQEVIQIRNILEKVSN